MKKLLLFTAVFIGLLLTAAAGYFYRDARDKIAAAASAAKTGNTSSNDNQSQPGKNNCKNMDEDTYDMMFGHLSGFTRYYDAFGRITGASRTDKNNKVTYYYNEYGKMTGTSTVGNTGRTTYYHDTRGRITGTAYTSDTGETTDYYDAQGMKTGTSYSDGDGTSYYYDIYGRKIGKSRTGYPAIASSYRGKPYYRTTETSCDKTTDIDNYKSSSPVINNNAGINTLNIYYN